MASPSIEHDFTLSPEGEARHARLQQAWSNPDAYEAYDEPEGLPRRFWIGLAVGLSIMALVYGLLFWILGSL